MRKLLAFVALAAFAGDWLTVGGDPQHSGWQRHGKRLTPVTAKDLKLLWKRQVDKSLTSPIILGPTITHRGVRELVFVAGASDLYAFDADLGTLFWKRHFEVDGASRSCGVSPPVIATDPEADVADELKDEDDNDDEPDSMRPLYVVAGDGRLHTIRVSDGADTSAPIAFLSPGIKADSLNFDSDMVYAATSQGCGDAPGGIWAINVTSPGAKASLMTAQHSPVVTIGFDARIYAAIGDKVVSLGSKDSFTAPEPLSVPPVVFRWQRRPWIAAGGQHALFVLDAAHLTKVAAADGVFTGGLATWQDPAGVRWIYAATADRIVAFNVIGSSRQPKLQPAWESQIMTAAGSPVVTHGVVLTLTNGQAHAVLHALDAATGHDLYSSGDIVPVRSRSPEVALANGHACFVTVDSSLYCFGIPIERE